MPTSRTVAIPLRNYQTGERDMPATTIPDWATRLEFEFARCTTATPTIWPNEATVLTMTLEVSVDGGQTWAYAGFFSANGGIAPIKGGGESAISGGSWDLLPGTNRQIRGLAVITNGPLRTEGTLQLVG